jgi:hypothetical protein
MVGIDTDDVDAFRREIGGKLGYSLVILFDDRTLRRHENENRAVLALQIIERFFSTAGVSQKQ